MNNLGVGVSGNISSFGGSFGGRVGVVLNMFLLLL